PEQDVDGHHAQCICFQRHMTEVGKILRDQHPVEEHKHVMPAFLRLLEAVEECVHVGRDSKYHEHNGQHGEQFVVVIPVEDRCEQCLNGQKQYDDQVIFVEYVILRSELGDERNFHHVFSGVVVQEPADGMEECHCGNAEADDGRRNR